MYWTFFLLNFLLSQYHANVFVYFSGMDWLEVAHRPSCKVDCQTLVNFKSFESFVDCMYYEICFINGLVTDINLYIVVGT